MGTAVPERIALLTGTILTDTRSDTHRVVRGRILYHTFLTISKLIQ